MNRACFSDWCEDGPTVPGLRGVIATAATVEECRASLTEVIEAWVLVRVVKER